MKSNIRRYAAFYVIKSRYAKKLGIRDDIFNFFRKFRLFDISVKDMRFNFAYQKMSSLGLCKVSY